MEINMNDKKYLKWYQKLAYGSGDLASNCSYGLVSRRFLWQYDRQDEKQTGKSKTVDAVCTDRRISLPGITFFNPEYGTNCAICIFLCILYLSERDFLHSKRCCILDTVSTDYQ